MSRRTKFIIYLSGVALVAAGLAFAYFRWWKWPDKPDSFGWVSPSPGGKRVAVVAFYTRGVPDAVVHLLAAFGLNLTTIKTYPWIIDVDTGSATLVDHEVFLMASLGWRSDSRLAFVSGDLESYRTLWEVRLPDLDPSQIDNDLYSNPMYSPEGRRFAVLSAAPGPNLFSGSSGPIDVFDAASMDRIATTPSRSYAFGWQWSHDGSKILYRNASCNQILRFDVDSGTEELLFESGKPRETWISSPALSPDESELAFETNDSIRVMNLEDRSTREVVSADEGTGGPVVWNRAGIWYSVNLEESNELARELRLFRDGQSRSIGSGKRLEFARLNEWEVIVRTGAGELSIVNGKTGEWRTLYPR